MWTVPGGQKQPSTQYRAPPLASEHGSLEGQELGQAGPQGSYCRPLSHCRATGRDQETSRRPGDQERPGETRRDQETIRRPGGDQEETRRPGGDQHENRAIKTGAISISYFNKGS